MSTERDALVELVDTIADVMGLLGLYAKRPDDAGLRLACMPAVRQIAAKAAEAVQVADAKDLKERAAIVAEIMANIFRPAESRS